MRNRLKLETGIYIIKELAKLPVIIRNLIIYVDLNRVADISISNNFKIT